MKKTLILFVSLLLMLGMIPAHAAGTVASGTCGDHLTWTLNADGVLTVSGTGEMIKSNEWGTTYRKDIKEVIIEVNASSVDAHAFYDCPNLRKVTFPASLKEIGRYAFYRCVSLEEARIPNNVSVIGEYAFLGCTSLSHVELPVSLAVVSDYVFDACINLTGITIPPGVISIGNDAFYECYSLTSVEIPGRVGIIKINAFSKCKGLRQVLIPKSVGSIALYAFSGCGNLSDVYYTGTEEEWNRIEIDKSNEELLNATIHFEWKGGLPKLLAPGDLDGDGQVLAGDARVALRASAGLETLGAAQTKAADVNADGRVLADDARQILRFSAKLQSSFEKKV
ncbi:MAG: leucine-rich repeat protein [Clostridia bacterium]|nr:leucine-rich repeat protein [Clostridia bacterium]